MLQRRVVAKEYFLLIHDALKRVDGECTVSAFVKNKHKWQSEMVCQRKTFEDTPEATADFARRLQHNMPNVTCTPCKRRVDVVFQGTKEALSVQLGRPNVKVEDINSLLEYEDRVPLRSSLGYDEERFAAQAPPLATWATALLEKWAFDNFTEDFQPHRMYWLAHSYSIVETYPMLESPHAIAGGVRDKFWELYEKAPFDNPYCPGEDLNTMRKARNVCRATHPNWDSSYEGPGDITMWAEKPGLLARIMGL